MMAADNQTPAREELARMASFAEALAHPTRLAVLYALCDQDRQTEADLRAVPVGGSGPLSRHLQLLFWAGLLTEEAGDGAPTYSLASQDICDLLHQLREWTPTASQVIL